MTPLHVAAERGDRFNIGKYLIGKGTDINIQDKNGVNYCTTAQRSTYFVHCSHILLFSSAFKLQSMIMYVHVVTYQVVLELGTGLY